MPQSILGARIRQRRRELGVTQADLARRIGISPSYLNLIEWNKRRIAGTLLRRTAQALELPLDELEDASERRLSETLVGLAHHPLLRGQGVESERTNELIGRFPGWARGLGALARAEREAQARVQILSDRLSNDPYLGEILHRMLTRIAAARSTTEILSEYPDLSQDQRLRFSQIVHDEVGMLSEVGEALAAYLERSDQAGEVLTPADEVESLFRARDNCFREIEEATRRLTLSLGEPHPDARQEEAQALSAEHLGDLADALIDDQPEIKTAAARGRARRALLSYGAGAIAMPMELFAERAAAARYDIEVLAAQFSSGFEAVCRRLTALPGAEKVPRFGYLRANAAGTIIENLGLRGLAVPRYAAACPLWVLYGAQQSPEAVIRQRVLFPSGERFVFVARARHKGPSGFGKPRHYVTDMVAMKEEEAGYTVYQPEPSAIVEEVGPTCRLCPRISCLHRVEDPLAE
ncbi:MAG: short-chain fatty acyl-CoA regulator family protein [Pseudomonadota bacterium]